MNERGQRIQRIAWGDPEFAKAKWLEFQIFGVANNFTTAADAEVEEMTVYRPWERSSEFYVAYRTDTQTREERPIAIARYLRHDSTMGIDSFSTLRDFRCYRARDGRTRNYLFSDWDTFFSEIDPHHIAELATQAVLPRYRRFGVMEAIWRRFARDSEDDGVRIWTMALVVPLFRWYKAMLPNALHAIGQLIPDYVGADSIPAMLALDHPSMIEVIAAFDAMQEATLPGACAVANSVAAGRTV